MVRTIIYSIILLPLVATFLWLLWASGALLARIIFWIIVIALAVCVVDVIKGKVSG